MRCFPSARGGGPCGPGSTCGTRGALPGRGLRLALLTLATLGVPAYALGADATAVAVDNASTPTLCAETDNVYLKLTSEAVRRFTIEAVHPAYAGTIVADRTAPDFRHCDMSGDPVHRAEPRRVTLFETAGLQLVGHTFPSFWREGAVPVRVGGRVETGLHLLQLYVQFRERTEEVLVLYPPDGYWRARPLPPENLSSSAYGSSFLVGPVETAGRPFVDIRDIAFDPVTRTFRLAFARGGEATLRLDAVDRERLVLDVSFDRTIAARPFAALRSMFVTETDADVAQAAWLAPGGKAWETAPVMAFGHAAVTELWAGRRLPSRHNTSAPDMIFRAFTSD
ncbi:MAG: hypothetical protein J2P53_08065 [Bradyrhizobiaceae bacterium]|nr:hypothetical protein [Bradyrhizobiaceae bacterium]